MKMAGPHPREDVWAYPRPPRVDLVDWSVRVEHRGVIVADASEAYRVLEKTHPPVYYIAPRFVAEGCLVPSRHRPSWCEWKGWAKYYDLVAADSVVAAACWSYPKPTSGFELIADAVAFYPSRVDGCFVDGERVIAQEGDFYGGWITSWIDAGRRGFKGGPGTGGW